MSPSGTVYGTFAESAARWPNRHVLQVLPGTAAVYNIAAGRMTYTGVLQQTNALADEFQASGYGAGMRIALLLENRPEFFIIWLALNRLGASVVPINPDLRMAELEYLIGHAEPALVITIDSRKAELTQAAANAQVTLSVVTTAALSALDAKDSPPLPPPRPDATVTDKASDLAATEAAVLYTSGTTGNPKGCVLSNNYFTLCGHWYAKLGGIGTLNTDGESMITPLPVFHMNAMAYSFMAMVTVGGCLTVLDRFHPSSWWQDVSASGATCLHYLGVMPSLLMNADPSAADQQHKVRFGFGAGVDPKLHAAFEARFGFPLIEAWAMTETGAGAVVAANTDDRLIGVSCLGVFDNEIDHRIVDDSGTPAEPGTPGELLVRLAGTDPRFGFFSHYYKDEAATAEAWRSGWFHTGDLVRQDESGRIYFVDRKKNVIRRSGENIAAVEVESILMRHEAIQAAAVTSVPDDIRGDEVFACLQVAPAPSAQLAESICQWCLQQMAYYKVPGYIAFVETLPLTATQKVQRAALKKLAADLMPHPDTINTTALKKRQMA